MIPDRKRMSRRQRWEEEMGAAADMMPPDGDMQQRYATRPPGGRLARGRRSAEIPD